MCKELFETKRARAGTIYFILGVIIIALSYYMEKYFLLWSLGWSGIGVGAGLINTRTENQQALFHLAFYWLFVWVFVFFTSLAVSIYISKVSSLGKLDLLSASSLKLYSLSAIVGLTGGFLGYSLHKLLENYINQIKPRKH